jgi:hypothetical protein
MSTWFDTTFKKSPQYVARCTPCANSDHQNGRGRTDDCPGKPYWRHRETSERVRAASRWTGAASRCLRAPRQRIAVRCTDRLAMCMVDAAIATVCLAKSMVFRPNRRVPFAKAMFRHTMPTGTPLILTVIGTKCMSERRTWRRHPLNSTRHASGHTECDGTSTSFASIGSV